MNTTKEQRSLRVAQMRAHFAEEGRIPNPEKEALLDLYIEGTATLADVVDHAREYVTTTKESEELRLTMEREAPQFRRMREQYEASIPAYEEARKQKNIERREMSEEQRERHEAVDAARANVQLSGGKISEESRRLSLRWADGEINMEEYLALVFLST